MLAKLASFLVCYTEAKALVNAYDRVSNTSVLDHAQTASSEIKKIVPWDNSCPLPEYFYSKVGWHVFSVTSKNPTLVRGFVNKEVWAFTNFRPLQSFLEKVAASTKVVTSIVENDTMIHIKGVGSTRMFFLNLSFLPDG